MATSDGQALAVAECAACGKLMDRVENFRCAACERRGAAGSLGHFKCDNPECPLRELTKGPGVVVCVRHKGE